MTFPEFEKRYTYDKKDHLGSGGFAEVFKARDNQTGYFVAIKVSKVKPEFGDFTLLNEVELAKKIPSHPNIAHYEACYRFDMGIMGLHDIAVLKYYELGNLDVFLQNRKNLSDSEIREILRGILHGLQVLHEEKMVHRDLKASNILMDRENGIWMPKIADFGLSGAIHLEHSVTNDAVGFSYYYAAPEQIRGEKILKNVDFWAFGVLTYRLLLNEMPFQGQTGTDKVSLNIQISKQITDMVLPEKSKMLPAPYKEIWDICWIENKSERVQEAATLLKLLESDDYQPVIIPKPTPSTITTLPPPHISAGLAWKKMAWITGGSAVLIGAWLMFKPTTGTGEQEPTKQHTIIADGANSNSAPNPTPDNPSVAPSAAMPAATPNKPVTPAAITPTNPIKKPQTENPPPVVQNPTTKSQDGTTKLQDGTTKSQDGTTKSQDGTTKSQDGTTKSTTDPTKPITDQPKPATETRTTDPPKSGVNREPMFPVPDLADYLKKHINHSKLADGSGIDKVGTIQVGFYVMKDGSIDKKTLTIIGRQGRNLDAKCENEALRVVRTMKEWVPGYVNGKPTSMPVSVFVTFE